MRKPHPYENNPNNNSDPYMVAALISNLVTERNPIQAIVGDFSRMLGVLANLGKTRQVAQQRIEQLQAQVSRVEGQIEGVNPKTTGNRFDRLR